MAFTTTIDPADIDIPALGPAVATSNLMIATSQALALAAYNATAQQQQSFTVSHAATTQFVASLGQPAAPTPPWAFA